MGRRMIAHGQRIAAADVRTKIYDTIGKRVTAADADDVAQATYVRLLAMPSLPEAEHELLALVVTVVRARIIDHHRMRKVRERSRAEGAEVDEIAPEDGPAGVEVRAEWRETLVFVEAEVAAGRVQADVLRWAHALATGKTIDEIAVAEKRSASSIKMTMKRAREHLKKRWPHYATAGVAVMLLVFWIRRQEPQRVASGNPRAQWTAQDYRAQASRECAERRFEACERDLDEAKGSDPAGESRAEVKAMREVIAKGKGAPGEGGMR
jgi:DNA-directed RNA polymerase specialized sigma24 family protein